MILNGLKLEMPKKSAVFKRCEVNMRSDRQQNIHTFNKSDN